MGDKASLDAAREAFASLGSHASFTLTQGGIVVASGEGPMPDIMGEGLHYARVYEQDGPTVLEFKAAPLAKEPTP